MKELLFTINRKDFDIQYFSGTGAGGQYRNKHQNCIRLRHRDSGALSTGQSNRDRPSNIKEALNGLKNNLKFKMWINLKIQEALTGKSLEEKVEKLMDEKNLKIEYKEEGKWKENEKNE